MVKLGGSLYAAPELRGWLEALAALPVAVVIVPGGGPFAEQVRVAQPLHGFDEDTAHRMALLAMQQFGLLLAGIGGQWRPSSSVAALRRQRRTVWLPAAAMLDRAGVAASWAVTSDSLAAWLAARLAAAGLVLVKSVACEGAAITIAEASARGWLDAAFADYAESFLGPIIVAERSAHRGFDPRRWQETAEPRSLSVVTGSAA